MIENFTNQYNMYKNEKKMTSLELENGIVLPRMIAEDSPMWGLGGVCDKNNKFVELSEYHGGWADHGGIYEWDEEEFQDEIVVYFGIFFKHWGHFLVDLISRMWYFVSNNAHSGIKVVYLGEEQPDGNYLEFFELLGISAEQLIHVQKPTRFKKVIVPEVSCRTCIWYTDEFQSIFDYIIKKVKMENHALPDVGTQSKIYFSRLDFGKAKGTEYGEKMIARWLTENGYLVVSPEKLSLRDQVYLWNSMSEIVCLNGTIPINIAFSKKSDLKLTVMNKTSLVHKNLELFLLMRTCDITFLDVYYEPFKKYPKSIGAGPFLLCMSKDIHIFSKCNGMVLPASDREIKIDFCFNYIKLIWHIIDIKGRLRNIWWSLRKGMKRD